MQKARRNVGCALGCGPEAWCGLCSRELGRSGKERWDRVMGAFVGLVEAFGCYNGAGEVIPGCEVQGVRFKVTHVCSVRGQ